ncbi:MULTISPECIES: HAD family hydrolase [Paenibacillus]|uniref:HAD family hydrolase n=1 Tax=Paenibacillus residui TaxID=629724 RepID=A0ABW3DG40_9BACL|nr:HAD family hydrolase [Paenibacillus sp. 32O-W]
MEKRFIWFDLGYTLVQMQREEDYQTYLREQGAEAKAEEIARAYHLADKLFMREYTDVLGGERGTFFPWYIGVVNYYLGFRFPLVEQCRRLQELGKEKERMWVPYEFSAALLEQLKENSYGVGLISNWDHTARTVLEQCGLLPYFDHLFISEERGVKKPDKAIFEMALKAAGVSPEECVYVGDNYYDDVIGSRQAGMECWLINRFDRCGIEEIDHAPVIPSARDILELLDRQAVGGLKGASRH